MFQADARNADKSSSKRYIPSNNLTYSSHTSSSDTIPLYEPRRSVTPIPYDLPCRTTLNCNNLSGIPFIEQNKYKKGSIQLPPVNRILRPFMPIVPYTKPVQQNSVQKDGISFTSLQSSYSHSTSSYPSPISPCSSPQSIIRRPIPRPPTSESQPLLHFDSFKCPVVNCDYRTNCSDTFNTHLQVKHAW
jgi:hypothetical protein